MANLLGFGVHKADEVELDDGRTQQDENGLGSRFLVSNVSHSHDNPGFVGDDEPISKEEDDEDDDEADSDDPSSTPPEYSTEHPTNYIKTLQRLTREVLPHMDLYRDVRSVHALARPSLDELHEESPDHKTKSTDENEDTNSNKSVKFGWITGVMIRCLLNIWGPIMFLRLTWLVGQCGIVQAIGLVLLSDVITIITGLSISAISTNGLVKGGGTYYLISRSLGPEYGGSIGLLFSFANALAVAMHTVGFAESMKDLLKSLGCSIVDGATNDMRIIGVVTVVVLVAITIIGMEWEQKAQVVLLFILLAAIVDVTVGSFMPTEEKLSKGFVGWSTSVAAQNWDSEYRKGESFFSTFAVFFPASTGILAGANISGDLKDPSSAIPKGTLLAIVFSSIVYIFFIIISGFTVFRDANGADVTWANYTMVQNCTAFPGDLEECRFGLENSYQVMEVIAAFNYLVYAGCFAATLSSALACLVSAPKIFQALCRDKIYPKIEWFGKGFGKNDEAIRAYILAFFIAVIFIIVADLNFIAPLISNFFMAAYCLINFACFHAALAKSPGFRPGFRFWNKWVSLIGSLLSMAVMFVMGWPTALATFFICFALYLYLSHTKPDVNWGSSQQAVSYVTALKAVQELVQIEDHVKNYRPQILAFTGPVHSRPALIDFGYHITKGLGLLVCGFVSKNTMNHHARNAAMKKAYTWLGGRKVKAFYNLVQDDSLAHGARAMIQATGVGKLRPNMVLLGFMNNWNNRKPEEILDYFNTIHTAFDLHLGVGILRVEPGLDYSFFTDEKDSSAPVNGLRNGHILSIRREESSASLASITSSSDSIISMESSKATVVSNPEGKAEKKPKTKKNKGPLPLDLPKDIQKSVDLFRAKHPHNKNTETIDVWWLYDDGGLTLLIPYILTTRKYYGKAKLRVFSLANKNLDIDQQQLNLASLLSKFRIDFQDVTVLPDITKKPKEYSTREFEYMVEKFREKTASKDLENGLVITDSEYLSLRDKTNRYIRVRELLLQHSRNAKLVVVTMPMPRKNRVSAPLYLAWLDTLTRDMPPTVLIRGNQTSVLTFYS